ncbi:MAG: endonuclease III, partial [Candidatus Limnocylindrales bacterium]
MERRRPGLVSFVLERLAAMYGVPAWQALRDGIYELVLTILSQNTSDLNAERAFDELRRRFPTWDGVERADPEALVEAIRTGGL